MEEVTIGVVNFNGQKTLPETVRSIVELEYPAFNVMIVDNNSTDGSLEWVQQNYPEIRCVCLDKNLGPAGAKNRILQEAKTEYVLILDNDIVVEPDTLYHLVEATLKVPQAGLYHAEICDPADPAVHHYNGGWIHYLGGFISRSKPEPSQIRPQYEIHDVVSGAAILIKRSIALQIGGFDEAYFFNWEDGDFSARFTLAGYLCLNVPSAVVHHRSKPRGTSKVFYQTRNRWFFILKLYSWRTLLLSAPIFLLFELCQMLLLLSKGALGDYWRGNIAVLRSLPSLLEKRRAFQELKVKKDSDWLTTGDLYVPSQLVKHPGLQGLQKTLQVVFNLYWKMIRPILPPKSRAVESAPLGGGAQMGTGS
jgi:GT2 family glycosyltransferase